MNPARSRAAASERSKHRVRLGLEAANLLALGAEPLDDTDPREALLHDPREIGELLLQGEVHRRDPVGEPSGRHVEERQCAEREQREDRVLPHHDHQDATHREHRRDGQRDEDHDGLHLLDIGVGARHELAGLGLVVEREVQPLKVREQPVAEIGLGPQRDPKRGVAPQSGADRLHDADEHHDHREPNDLAFVARPHAVVDRRGREQRDRQLGGGPDDAGGDTADDPPPLRRHRTAHEPPTVSAAGFVEGGLVRGAELGFHDGPRVPRSVGTRVLR